MAQYAFVHAYAIPDGLVHHQTCNRVARREMESGTRRWTRAYLLQSQGSFDMVHQLAGRRKSTRTNGCLIDKFFVFAQRNQVAGFCGCAHIRSSI